MKTVGIDLSLTRTGVGACRDGRVFRGDFLGTKPGRPDGERFDAIANFVVRWIRHHKPDAVTLEAPAHSRGENRNAELQGAVKMELWRLGVEFELVYPNSLKKDATGYGRASKDEMLEAAKLLWAQCPNHDVADAIHLAHWAYKHR